MNLGLGQRPLLLEQQEHDLTVIGTHGWIHDDLLVWDHGSGSGKHGVVDVDGQPVKFGLCCAGGVQHHQDVPVLCGRNVSPCTVITGEGEDGGGGGGGGGERGGEGCRHRDRGRQRHRDLILFDFVCLLRR